MTYESVFAGQAEMEKFSKSTFSERKIMSTKTSIKRIAAVAAVALTLGGFSAVTAHATETDTWAYSQAYNTSTGTAVIGGQAKVTFNVAGGANGAIYNVTSTGVGSISYAAGSGDSTHSFVAPLGSPAAATVSFPTSSLTFGLAANGITSETLTVTATSATAGTQTFSITPINTTTGVAGTATTKAITWVAATTTAVSAQYTTSGMTAGQGSPTLGTNAVVLAANTAQTAASSAAATILVAPADGGNNSLASEKLTVSVSGPGTIGVGVDNTVASAGRAVTGAAGAYTINVFGDGTSGVSTITVSDGATVLTTKTVTFTGSVAKATVTQVLNVARAGTQLGATPNANAAINTQTTVNLSPAFIVTFTDSNGNQVAAGKATAYGALKLTSSDSTIIVPGTCTEYTTPNTATKTYNGKFECYVSGAAGAVSGSKATITVGALLSDTVTRVTSDPITFSIGGSISKEVLALGATSYSPLAPVTATITATDSSGNPAYDQDGIFAKTVVYNTYLGGADLGLGTTSSVINGVATYTGAYAPSIEGTLNITGVDAVSTAAEALSATASIVGGGGAASAAQAAVDAANEATDAANAATDAANNAMDSADAAQQAALDAGDKADAALAAVTDLATKVSAIATQIAALSALVKKIAAKVKA